MTSCKGGYTLKMSVNSVVNVKSAQEILPLNEQNPEKFREGTKGSEKYSGVDIQKETEKLIPALEKLNKTAPIFDFRFHFLVHEETKRIMVQIIDQETGEVLNEIPPEKVLDLVARIQELVGLLVDERR